MNLIIDLICGIYAIILSAGIFIWLFKLRSINIENKEVTGSFSVIIPVRNEEKNIARLLDSLMHQSISKDNFEVILVDDQSEDNTVAVAKNIFENSGLSWRILSLGPEDRGNAPKKNAVTKAIHYARNELIFCTDGDCELPFDLLSEYQKIFTNPKVVFISGAVSFFKVKKSFFRNIWNKIQTIEFASLVAAGGTSIQLKRPNMCSGANIAYRRAAFFEVKGYEGNEFLASGDDEFLMHKIFQKFPDGVCFSGQNNTLVLTNDTEDIFEFYNQRKRWASKWNYYKSWTPKILAIYIFMLNLGSIYLLISGLWFWLGLRASLEIIFLGLVLVKFKKTETLPFIPLVQIFYPFYVVFFGLKSLFSDKKYIWKNRELS